MRQVISIPAPVTAARPIPASIVVELEGNGAGRAIAPGIVEYEQLVHPLDACFGERVGRVTAANGLWVVEIKPMLVGALETAA